MLGEYHIKIKKDYASSVIEDLIKMDAVEDIHEQEHFTLRPNQIEAIENEQQLIANNPSYLKAWDDVKQQFKRPQIYTICISTNAALNDISEAVDYWNSKRENLGYDFVDEVEASFTSIKQIPTAFSKRYKAVRGKLVKRFPYLILYPFLLYIYYPPSRTFHLYAQKLCYSLGKL